MNDGCQNQAMWLVCTVRTKSFTSSTCTVSSGEPNTGGGPSRTSLAEPNAHGFQLPASGKEGAGLLRLPGTGGNDPVNTASEPSPRARVTTRSATPHPRL